MDLNVCLDCFLVRKVIINIAPTNLIPCFQTWRKIAQKRGLKFEKHFGKVSKVWKNIKICKEICIVRPQSRFVKFCQFVHELEDVYENGFSYYLGWNFWLSTYYFVLKIFCRIQFLNLSSCCDKWKSTK